MRREEVFTAERVRDPRADIVAERDRGEKRRSVRAEVLARGERRRNDRAARVCDRRGVRIVGFVGVRGHAVGQCCVVGPHAQRGPEHVRAARRRERGDERDRPFAGREARPGDARRERIEDVVFRFLHDLRRQRPRGRAGDEIGENLRVLRRHQPMYNPPFRCTV
jgi:hypothetical protein